MVFAIRPPRLFGSILILCAAASVVRADTPLPPPKEHEVVSRDGSHVAVTDPRTLTTTVYAVGKDGKRERGWAMYGWFRALYLSDDGEHVVVGYDGLNLLPTECPPEAILVRFFHRGEQIATVTLGEIVPDRSVLRRTASHLLWRNAEGLDAEGRFVVETVDAVRHVYDVATGRAPTAPRR